MPERTITLIVFVGCIVGIVILIIWWYLSSEDDDAPAITSPEPGNNGIYELPVLPKGSPFVYGALVCFGLFFIIWAGGYHSLGWIFPTAMIGGFAFIAWAGTLSTGAILGLGLYIQGFKAETIPIGWRGVPTFLGARVKLFGFKVLFNEGSGWNIKGLAGFVAVNTLQRPLIDKVDPTDDEIEIVGLNVVLPPHLIGPQKTEAREAMERFFFTKVTVRVAVRIKVFDPFLYTSSQDAEGILFSAIREQVRLWVRDKQLFELPNLKENLTDHLLTNLDGIGADMGIDFIKLFVTEILPPEDVLNAAAQIPITLISRAKTIYQAETIDMITDRLKGKFSDLDGRDLKNLVLTSLGLATTQVVSIEGQQGGLSLVGVNPKGDH